MKLNKTDFLLIKALQKNGSASYSDLAGELGITAKTVAKKTDRLLKNKVISIIARPNPYRLGLLESAFIALKTNLLKNGEICRYLSDNFNVNLVQTVFGSYDIIAVVYFQDLQQLHKFIDEELYTLDGVIKVKTYFIKDTYKRYDRFFEKESFSQVPVKMKETDWELVKTLSCDARTNPAHLAEAFGIHLSTVYRRIETLQKTGAISISAVPNPSRLTPHSSNAFVILETPPQEVELLFKKLRDCPEVHFLMTTNTHSGLIACIHSKDNASLFQFIQQYISSPNGLLNADVFIRAMVHKTYYNWFKDDAVPVDGEKAVELAHPDLDLSKGL